MDSSDIGDDYRTDKEFDEAFWTDVNRVLADNRFRAPV